MARISRVVAPGLPPHIIHRGNRRKHPGINGRRPGIAGKTLSLLKNWAEHKGVASKPGKGTQFILTLPV